MNRIWWTAAARPARRRQRVALAVTCVLLSGTAVASAAPTDAGPRPETVDVAPGDCGHGRLPHLRPGPQMFVLRNTSATPADARLVDAATGAVHGEVEGIAPGTHRTFTARLGPGAYAFVCLPDDADPVTGPAVRIPGTGGGGGPAAVPVTRDDLIPLTLDYQRWVGERMAGLVTATDALRTAVDSGDPAAARAAWLPAHLAYGRLGAAYGAFGDAGRAVDGTAAGLPGGVRDPGFTGFHRVEHGLWHGERGPALRRAAHRLAVDVHALRDSWELTRMDPADLGRRAHEILEDTLQHELTGRTDHGSGSGLATARANLDGTRAVLDRLRPLLRGRYPGAAVLDRRLDRAADLLDRYGPAAGRTGPGRWTPHRWTPLARLGRADREKIDAAIGDLTERLASVATLCEPRRTP